MTHGHVEEAARTDVVVLLHSRRRKRAHGRDWMDIWATGMLFAEAAEHRQTRHHVARPTILTAMVTLGLGVFHGRLAARTGRRRSLRLTRDHLFAGGSRFNTFTARWDKIAEMTVTEREASIRTHQGRRRRLNLADLQNASANR